MEDIVSGVGVLDKAMAILAALERSPRSLAELTGDVGASRATTHRLAVALEVHGVVRREGDGRFVLGPRLVGLGREAGERFAWWDSAAPVLARLRDETGESVQLFLRQGERRVCVESLESSHGLRWIVPVGAVLPLERGSAGRVLLDAGSRTDAGPGGGARGDAAGWVESVEEREPGVASVSAAVRDAGVVVAAVSVSGPLERMGTEPGARFGAAVVAAARALERASGLRP